MAPLGGSASSCPWQAPAGWGMPASGVSHKSDYTYQLDAAPSSSVVPGRSAATACAPHVRLLQRCCSGIAAVLQLVRHEGPPRPVTKQRDTGVLPPPRAQALPELRGGVGWLRP
jgi:hypothetical protein